MPVRKTITDQPAKVDTPCIDYLDMAERWSLIDDLLGGTLAMRAKGAERLPFEEEEDSDAYDIRLKLNVLHEGLANAIQRIVSRPFEKEVTLEGTVSDAMADLWDDVDMTGVTGTDFAKMLMRDALEHGLSHFLVDYEDLSVKREQSRARGEPQLSLASAGNARARFFHVPAVSLIRWRVRKDLSGAPELSEIAIREERNEPLGEYGEEIATYVRIIRAAPLGEAPAQVNLSNRQRRRAPRRARLLESKGRATWELWRKAGDSEQFLRVQMGTLSIPYIPIVTYYTNRTGFMTARPPFEGLAWMNLCHWQSNADQRYSLRYGRAPMLALIGFGSNENEKVVVGAAQLFRSSNVNAKVFFVEPTGAALAAGEKDLDRLEARMEVLGVKPMIEKTQDSTAYGQAVNAADTNCDAQAWCRGAAIALREGCAISEDFRGTELAEDFRVNLFSDFWIYSGRAADMQILLAAVQAGVVSKETAFTELTRRGFVDQANTLEMELEKLDQQGPDLKAMSARDPEYGAPDDPPQPPKGGNGNPDQQGKATAAA